MLAMSEGRYFIRSLAQMRPVENQETCRYSGISGHRYSSLCSILLRCAPELKAVEVHYRLMSCEPAGRPLCGCGLLDCCAGSCQGIHNKISQVLRSSLRTTNLVVSGKSFRSRLLANQVPSPAGMVFSPIPLQEGQRLDLEAFFSQASWKKILLRGHLVQPACRQ